MNIEKYLVGCADVCGLIHQMCRLKAKAGKLWNRAQNFSKQKKVSVLNLFLSNTSVLIIINRFTLVFNGFNCKPYLKSKQ